MEGDLEDTDLVSFIENFPFPSTEVNKDRQKQEEYIFDLLKTMSKNPDITSSERDILKENKDDNGKDDDKDPPQQNNISERDKPKDTRDKPKENEQKIEDEDNQEDDKEEDDEEDEEYKEWAEDNPMIKRICDQLNSCYKEKGVGYRRMFSINCKDEGLTDDQVGDDLNGNYLQSDLVSMIDNFPFPSDEIRKDKKIQEKFIFDVLKMLFLNPGIISFDIPSFLLNSQDLKNMFYIEKDDLQRIQEKYEKQCPALYNDFSMDGTCFFLLAIGMIIFLYLFIFNLMINKYLLELKE